MNILDWIDKQLDKRRLFKLEYLRCTHCDDKMEIIKSLQHENERLIYKLTMVETAEAAEVDTSDLKPISPVSGRIRRAQESHNSFRRVQKLKEEFEAENATTD